VSVGLRRVSEETPKATLGALVEFSIQPGGLTGLKRAEGCAPRGVVKELWTISENACETLAIAFG